MCDQQRRNPSLDAFTAAAKGGDLPLLERAFAAVIRETPGNSYDAQFNKTVLEAAVALEVISGDTVPCGTPSDILNKIGEEYPIAKQGMQNVSGMRPS